jgi:hypothetical protein
MGPNLAKTRFCVPKHCHFLTSQCHDMSADNNILIAELNTTKIYYDCVKIMMIIGFKLLSYIWRSYGNQCAVSTRA